MGGGYHGGFGNTKGHNDEVISKLMKRSPIIIPEIAEVRREIKEGYIQIKFTWDKNDFEYESRWHTQTPNAPSGTGTTWVVERHRKGIGAGKNFRPAIREILIKNNKWISKEKWQDAIRAKRQGKLTDEQRSLLNDGHWKDKE